MGAVRLQGPRRRADGGLARRAAPHPPCLPQSGAPRPQAGPPGSAAAAPPSPAAAAPAAPALTAATRSRDGPRRAPAASILPVPHGAGASRPAAGPGAPPLSEAAGLLRAHETEEVGARAACSAEPRPVAGRRRRRALPWGRRDARPGGPGCGSEGPRTDAGPRAGSPEPLPVGGVRGFRPRDARGPGGSAAAACAACGFPYTETFTST